MLIPIGHENTEVRRLPWVTIGIILICTTLLWYTGTKQSEVYDDLVRSGSEIEEYYWAHRYLELDPAVAEILRIEVHEPDVLDLLERRYPWEEAEQQLDLDALTEQFLVLYAELPFRWLGLNPASLEASAWLTHMFTHAGLIHLLGNMFLLFLAGACIEDVWGRPIYAAFYLLAGVAGASFHIFMYPGVDMPLVGASGAVSGILGAFLVRYWRTRIRFFYWFFFFVRGTFRAPAWLILPLWLGNEILNASVMDQMMPGGGGVAHWAHIGGFAFGVVGALAIARLKLEERFINASIDSKVTFVSNEPVSRALEAKANGNPEVGFEILSEELRRDRSNYDAALALWDISAELDRSAAAVPAMAHVLREDLKNGDIEQALERVREIDSRVPNAPIEPLLLLRLGTALAQQGNTPGAAQVLAKAVPADGAAIPTAMAIRLARVARELDPAVAGRAARIALAAPDLDPADRTGMQELLDALGEAAAPSEPPESAASPEASAFDLGVDELGEPEPPLAAQDDSNLDLGTETDRWELDEGSGLDPDEGQAETVCQLSDPADEPPLPPGAAEIDLESAPPDAEPFPEAVPPAADDPATMLYEAPPEEPASDATQLFTPPPAAPESDRTQLLSPDDLPSLEAPDATVLQVDVNADEADIDFLDPLDPDEKED